MRKTILKAFERMPLRRKSLLIMAVTIILLLVGLDVSGLPLHAIIEKLDKPIDLTLTIIPFLVAAAILKLRGKALRDSPRDSSSTTPPISSYEPKKAKHVETPMHQRLKLVASAPAKFLDNLIKQTYMEMREVYGDIPLWVRHRTNIVGHSWDLNHVKASHTIDVYGEKCYVQKFLGRLNEELKVLCENSSTVKIGSIESETVQESFDEDRVFPKDVKRPSKGLDMASLLSGLGLLGIALAILSIVSGDWKSKRTKSAEISAVVEDEKALESAIEAIKGLGLKDQELKAQRKTEDGWLFLFTDYEVRVDKRGYVTSVRRCTR